MSIIQEYISTVYDNIDFSKSIGIIALFISVVNAFFTWQNRRLAVEQEKRRMPLLRLFYINGYYQERHSGNERIYAFLISASNPTDNANSIASSDLAITYVTKDKMQMTMKIKSLRKKGISFVESEEQEFLLPVAIPAHGTVAGWISFAVPWSPLQNADILSHKILIKDSHGKDFELVPIIVQELINEVRA